MATITIEAPVSEDLNYVIEDVEKTSDLIVELNNIAVRVNKKPSRIIPPRVPRDVAYAAGFGSLKTSENGADIARRLREANRKVT